MVPHYENVYEWELYNCDILTEYQQCIDEGLEIEQYKGLFEEVAKLPKDVMIEIEAIAYI